jgi:hypothetical protein
MAKAANYLLSSLIECWDECAPNQVLHDPDLQSVQCLSAVVDAVTLVCRSVLLDLKLPNAGMVHFSCN